MNFPVSGDSRIICDDLGKPIETSKGVSVSPHSGPLNPLQPNKKYHNPLSSWDAIGCHYWKNPILWQEGMEWFGDLPGTADGIGVEFA